MENMRDTYIVVQIEPSDYGADLTFMGPGGARVSSFSVPCKTGIVELRLTLDLFEPRVLDCNPEETKLANKVSSRKLPARAADRQKVLEVADELDSGLPPRGLRKLWGLVRGKASQALAAMVG